MVVSVDVPTGDFSSFGILLFAPKEVILRLNARKRRRVVVIFIFMLICVVRTKLRLFDM
jgi:hypothetical protein